MIMKEFKEVTELISPYDIRNISPPGEMLLFDIETTGLKKETTQIYLIGCGYFDPDGLFTVRQWLTESAQDERYVLEEFAAFASHFRVLLHFNGDGFDIPYTSYKLEQYGIDLDLYAMESIDIYKKIKPYKKFLALERLNQTSVERFLKVERKDVMNGGLLIPYYYEYEKTGSPECEYLLLLHNSDDVKGMIQLTALMSYADLFDGLFDLARVEVAGGASGRVLVLEYGLKSPVPVSVNREKGCLNICAEKDLLQINIDIYDGVARIPVENYQDYYYLPEEDQVIHKDVAQFVDKKFRRKATKSNCYLKKQGAFIPSFGLPVHNLRSGSDDATPAISSGIASYIMIPGEKGRLTEAIELEKVLDSPKEFYNALALKALAEMIAK